VPPLPEGNGCELNEKNDVDCELGSWTTLVFTLAPLMPEGPGWLVMPGCCWGLNTENWGLPLDLGGCCGGGGGGVGGLDCTGAGAGDLLPPWLN